MSATQQIKQVLQRSALLQIVANNGFAVHNVKHDDHSERGKRVPFRQIN
jgi:hypothetical protein